MRLSAACVLGKCFQKSGIKVNATNQTDRPRIVSDGVIKLRFQPGDYYLQLTVTDKATKSKQNSTSESIDFEIIKRN